MGPAVTSEAVSCEREKRLRTTASHSPHNTHSDPLPTGMNPEESGGLAGCQSITPLSSCQIVEPAAGRSTDSSGPQLDLSVEDNRVLSSSPGESLNLCKVNSVNLKDIHSRPKVSIFIKNNTTRMLPNGGTGHSIGSNEKLTHQVAATATCDGTVPCGTAASSHLVRARVLNSSQTDNGLSATSKVHHMIIIPKTPVIEETPKSRNMRESEPVGPGGACSVATADVGQEKPAHSDTRSAMERIISRQRKLNIDASRLLKRLRRLQCREVNSAVKEKLGQVVTSLGHALGDRPAVTPIHKSTNKDTLGSDELNALSTRELVSYVKKMQHSFFSRPAAPHSSHPADLSESLSKLNEVMRLDLRDTSGQLMSNMRHLKSALDSDATESSSGGESSDESPPLSKEFPDVASASAAHRKLEWEWTKDRANIVSRWTWLHAQISDLEYRIRQQNDVYKQLRQSKGSVSLRDPACQSESFEMTGELNGRIKISRSCAGEDSNVEGWKNLLAVDNTSCATNAVENRPTEKTSSDSTNSRNRVCINLLSVRTAQLGMVEPSPEAVQNLDRSSNSGEKSKDVLISSSSVAATSSSMASSSAAPFNLAPSSVTAPSSSLVPLPSSMRLAVSIPSTAVPLSSASMVPSLLCDPSCRAARCMEVRSWRRRPLLRTAGLHELSRKASQLSTVSCACYPPVTPCALCGGRYNKVKKPGPQVSARDRIALLEPSYHPVLSFPRDVSLPLQMAECLWKGPNRSETDARHRLQDEHATKSFYRQVTTKNKINGRSHSNDLQHEEETTDQSNAKAAWLVGRSLQPTSLRGRKSNLHAMETMRKKKKHLSLARKHLSKTSLRASSLKGNRTQLMRRGSYNTLRNGGLKRISSRSTFDINNVVIPSHVTSAARVDIIHYKEITTPKWREVDGYVKATTGNGTHTLDLPLATSAAMKRPKLSTSEGSVSKKVRWSNEEIEPSARCYSSSTELCGDDTDAEEEIANLSDEAFAARHLRYEIYEKKQCLPTTAGQQRRSRSNRSESDSFTALNPQSPDVTNPFDASASLTSSTLSGVPSTSCLGYSDAEDSGHNLGDSFPTRQHSETKLVRNCSTASWILSASHSSELLTEPAENQPVPTWPPRTFPLGDIENQQLFAENPLNSVDQTDKKVTRSASPAVSTSSDSSVPGDEDPNDPEWTVTPRNKDKLGILIKFAKV